MRHRSRGIRGTKSKGGQPSFLGYPPLTCFLPGCLLGAEGEQIEQVADRRSVERYVRIALVDHRIGVIVAAARRDRSKSPVPFDEFQYRNMVGIRVRDVAGGSEGRDHQGGDSGAVAEEIERLDVTGIVIA